MSMLAWISRNWADTDEGHDPALVPFVLPLPVPEAVALVQRALGRLPRWRVETADPAAGRIHATRRTRLFGFIDDLHFRIEPEGPGSRVHARSQSRVGKGDFGQNRRNLLQVFRAIQAQVPPP